MHFEMTLLSEFTILTFYVHQKELVESQSDTDVDLLEVQIRSYPCSKHLITENRLSSHPRRLRLKISLTTTRFVFNSF
jgi:hypothetical protein